MPTANPGYNSPIKVRQALTTTTGFSSTHDISVTRTCRVTEIELKVPSGEKVDISKVSPGGSVVPYYVGAESGPYFLGEKNTLAPGEKLRFVSTTVVSGNREYIVSLEGV